MCPAVFTLTSEATWSREGGSAPPSRHPGAAAQQDRALSGSAVMNMLAESLHLAEGEIRGPQTPAFSPVSPLTKSTLSFGRSGWQLPPGDRGTNQTTP